MLSAKQKGLSAKQKRLSAKQKGLTATKGSQPSKRGSQPTSATRVWFQAIASKYGATEAAAPSVTAARAVPAVPPVLARLSDDLRKALSQRNHPLKCQYSSGGRRWLRSVVQLVLQCSGHCLLLLYQGLNESIDFSTPGK